MIVSRPSPLQSGLLGTDPLSRKTTKRNFPTGAPCRAIRRRTRPEAPQVQRPSSADLMEVYPSICGLVAYIEVAGGFVPRRRLPPVPPMSRIEFQGAESAGHHPATGSADCCMFKVAVDTCSRFRTWVTRARLTPRNRASAARLSNLPLFKSP